MGKKKGSAAALFLEAVDLCDAKYSAGLEDADHISYAPREARCWSIKAIDKFNRCVWHYAVVLYVVTDDAAICVSSSKVNRYLRWQHLDLIE